jgi:DHA1 family tetracycline resistance protein-like MFS transporter
MMGRKSASLGFIFVTVLIDMIGIGIIIPVLPDLIKSLTGDGYSEASRLGGLLIGAYAVMQFLFAPLMGQLSDQYGRKPVLLISLFVLGIDFLFHAYAPTIGWLFVGRFLAGITGASYTVASAYIADISSPETKAKNFGLLGAAFGLGFVIGPSLGGIASQWGVRAPFFLAAGLTFLNFLYGVLVLPESHKPENRRKAVLKQANPIGSLWHLKQYPSIIGFFIAFFFIYLAGQSVQSTWSFFTMYRFDWDATTVGYSLTLVGLIVAFVQAVLINWVVKKFGQFKTVVIGMAFWCTGLFLFAFATQSWMMFAFIIPYCLGGIAGPTLQGIISNEVPNNKQGELQGALTSIMSLTNIIGPVLMTFIFYSFTADNAPFELPGAAFLAGGLLMVASLIIALKPLRQIKPLAKKT